MLDNETKRRIDTARDILVGKVPDPKSQVEQITIALIYKFMDDMDAEAEELGGNRNFFVGEYAKYSWAKLMAPGRGGHEVLNLYGEAITKMTENEGIPALFRDIFKNAYLPYRDPETLKSFLKIINEFTYDHSERLGDAFEYLLSVLGSQGDAGQFRTPRHIIDFMVQVIDPQKQDSILDPACGTAGFLISSYKHIMAANAKNGRSGAALTPDERTRLLNNIQGYDISPDMVRLSLVNLYLHGFTDPHIYEYDTLTSDDRWNEYFDIVLANPPFMSPKGGIRPHKRFSVESKRSEVLFVDYIAEHLSPNGRAAVIVPEGIIFQGGNAYKQLRKMLVKDYLVGVISLPAGVFNPYSGVKTSILWLDKALAKQTDQIAFVKIEHDGFDLGAQRREIKKSDLPAALATITDYKASVVNGTDLDDEKYPLMTLVDKTEIAKNGDYNLSGERYRVAIVHNGKWDFVEVGNVTEKIKDSVDPKLLKGSVNYIGLENISQDTGELVGDIAVDNPKSIKSTKSRFSKGNILYGRLRPNLNKVWYSDRDGICSTDIFVIGKKSNNANLRFLAYLFRGSQFNNLVLGGLKGAQLPRVGWNYFAGIKIPLPPTAVQAEIVAEIESYQKIIDGARQVVDNYRPFVSIDPDWPIVEIGDIYDISYGLAESIPKNLDPNGIKIISTAETNIDGSLDLSSIRKIKYLEKYEKYVLQPDTLLFNWRNAPKHVGKTVYFNEFTDKYIFASFLLAMRRTSNEVNNLFYWLILNLMREEGYFQRMSRQAVNQTNFNATELSKTKVPKPPVNIQNDIVTVIEEEQALVQANRQLITRFEQKIKDRIARVWGEE